MGCGSISHPLLHLVPKLHPSGIIKCMKLIPCALPVREKIEDGIPCKSWEDVDNPLAWFSALHESTKDFEDAANFLTVPWSN